MRRASQIVLQRGRLGSEVGEGLVQGHLGDTGRAGVGPGSVQHSGSSMGSGVRLPEYKSLY